MKEKMKWQANEITVSATFYNSQRINFDRKIIGFNEKIDFSYFLNRLHNDIYEEFTQIAIY